MSDPILSGYKEPSSFSQYGRDFKRWINRKKAAAYEWILDFALKNHPDCKGSNIVSYADQELRLAGYDNPDGFYGGLLYDAAMRQARVFSIEGHSGMSAGIASRLSNQVCMFRPIAPLTGDDDEWNEVGENVFQNRRMSSIFKDSKDGVAYWSDGKIFEDPDGARYTNFDSRVPVSFPWHYREPEIVKRSS